MRTKTKVSTKTKVALAIGALGLAAAGSVMAAIPTGPGLTILETRSGNQEYVQGNDNVVLTTMDFHASKIDLNITDYQFEVIGDDDASFSTIENDARAIDMFDNCTLKETGTETVIGGPIAPDGSNMLVFTDDFSILAGTSVNAYIECQSANNVTSGDDDIYAARISKRTWVTYTDSSSTIIPANKTQLGTLNRGVNMKGKQTSATILEKGKITFSLSSSSPSGAAIPGDIEVYRFNVTADSSGDDYLDKILFEVFTTDNASSNWNKCGGSYSKYLDAADFTLYNLSTGSSWTLGASNTLYDGSGNLCTSSTVQAQYVKMDLTTMETIPAGTSYTYALYMNATGPSAVDDDNIQIEIPPQSVVSSFTSALDAVVWYDEAGNMLDGDDVNGLPLTGNTLVF